MKVLNRAKAIDGTGGYIISQSIKFENKKMFLYSIPFKQWVECDENTRSINIDGMLDENGNEIFASLQEDLRGGDICETDNGERIGVFFYHKYAMCIDLQCIEVKKINHNFYSIEPQSYKRRTKVIGIKE